MRACSSRPPPPPARQCDRTIIGVVTANNKSSEPLPPGGSTATSNIASTRASMSAAVVVVYADPPPPLEPPASLYDYFTSSTHGWTLPPPCTRSFQGPDIVDLNRHGWFTFEVTLRHFNLGQGACKVPVPPDLARRSTLHDLGAFVPLRKVRLG